MANVSREHLATAAPRRRWVGEAALASLCEHMPGFAGLALWLRHVERLDEQRYYAATDGLNVFYGAPFAGIDLREQMSTQAHEVLHAALQHPARMKRLAVIYGASFNPRLCNVAADAIINSALGVKSWFRLTPEDPTLPAVMKSAKELREAAGLQAPSIDPCSRGLHEWSLETLYGFLHGLREAAAQAQQGGGPGQALEAQFAGARTGRDIIPEENPSPAPNGVGGENGPRETFAENAVQDRMKSWNRRLMGLSAGRDTGKIIRSLVGDLPKVRTPWEQHLRGLLASALAIELRSTWTKANRRGDDNAPGWKRARPAPRLCVVADTSGSVDDRVLRRFAAEIQSVVLRTGAETTVISADAEVKEVVKPRGVDIGALLRRITFTGGGGTDFAPAVAEAAKHSPDAVIYMTDLQGSFGEKPRFPVIWAVPELQCSGAAKPPFGRVVELF